VVVPSRNHSVARRSARRFSRWAVLWIEVAFVDEFRWRVVLAALHQVDDSSRELCGPIRTTAMRARLSAEDIEAVRIQVLAALAVKLRARLREQGGDSGLAES